MGDSLQLLREEFADEDLMSKRRGAERIEIVAKALGPNRARGELLPWMLENIKQEDEILYIFARKLPVLAKLVGGLDNFDSMLPVVEALLQVDETYVRDATMDCCRDLLSSIKSETVLSQAAEAAGRLGRNEWFTPRMSACSLAGMLLSCKLPAEDARRLRETFLALCRDETPMVRRTAAKELPAVLKSLPKDVIVEEILPVFNKLSTDPQESVALNWISNLGELFASLSPELNKEHLLGCVKQYAGDRSWRIRATLAQNFDKICSGLDTATIQTVMLPVFCELLRDLEAEVRAKASAHIAAVAKRAGADAFVSQVIPVVNSLMELDAQRPVRLNFAQACVSRTMLEALGKGHVQSLLAPMWADFLNDSHSICAPEVRLIILNGLDEIVNVLGAETVASTWQGHLKTLFETSKHRSSGPSESMMNNEMNEEIEHPQWRLRVAVLAALAKLAGSGSAEIEKLLVDLWSASLSDEVFEVRIDAARALKTYCDASSSVGPRKVVEHFVPRLAEFFKQGRLKYHFRVIFVHAFGSIVQVDPSLAEPLMPAYEKCIDDKVPNVRLAAANVFSVATNEAFLERFSKKMKALSNDPDPDVRNLVRSCSQKML